MTSRLRVIFFGTSEFAVPALDCLMKMQLQPEWVVTQPDRPKGRGRKLAASPVKQRALDLGLSVLQPEKIKKNSEFKAQIESVSADLGVVVSYGRILPDWLLQQPRLGFVNLHASLLPAYRGAAPIQWSVIHGESEAGVTLMKVVSELDAGDIISRSKVTIEPYETYGQLECRLMQTTPGLLQDYLEKLSQGVDVPAAAQDEKQVTLAPPIEKASCQIDWNKSSLQIHNLVRGLHPRPMAVSAIKGLRVKVVAASVVDEDSAAGAGEILRINKHGIFVSCGRGVVCLQQLLPESKRLMDGVAAAASLKLQVGDCFAPCS